MADLANAVGMPVPSPGGSGSSKIAVTIDPFVIAKTYEILDRGAVGGAVPSIFQRIYDSTAGYVYYTQETVNPTPAFDETTPNHTNNLVAATHEVIKEN